MNSSGLTRGLVSLAAFVIFIAGLRAANSLIVPFLLSIFLAVITSPLMIQLKKYGIRQSVSVVIILFGVLGMLWVLIQVAGSSINQFARDAGIYQRRLEVISFEWTMRLRDWNVIDENTALDDFFNFAVIMRQVVNTLTAFLRGMVTNTFLVLLTVMFLLFELAGLPKKLLMAFGPDHPSVPGWTRFTESLNRYLAIKSVISLLTGLCAFLLTTFIGLDYALLWGILAFLLNYVPNIGSILAAIPPVLLALVKFDTAAQAVWTLVGYVLINLTFGNLIEPRVMGKGLGLSTLVVWLSLIFWGWVFGPIGMLLSVPLTMVVKIAMESKEETMWLAVMLGSDPGEEKEA